MLLGIIMVYLRESHTFNMSVTLAMKMIPNQNENGSHGQFGGETRFISKQKLEDE